MELQSRVPVLTALFGAVLLFASAALTVQETSPFLATATSEAGRFQAFVAREAQLPVAENSRADIVSACYSLMRSIFARAQPTERRLGLIHACRELALATTASAPTVAIAWTVAAATAGELDDADNFNRELARSAGVAPHEQWIAELRVALTENYFALASEQTQIQEGIDIAILVQTRRGIRSLAARYVDDPGFRERVTRIVEALPPDEQTRFLREVQAAARESVSADVG